MLKKGVRESPGRKQAMGLSDIQLPNCVRSEPITLGPALRADIPPMPTQIRPWSGLYEFPLVI